MTRLLIAQHIKTLQKELRNIRRRKDYNCSGMLIGQALVLQREIGTLQHILRLATS